MADKKTRNYYTVVYPDSAPKNWIDVLSEERVPAFVSPLHDADVNPDGEAKKPHWHVMIMFDGPKPADRARAIFDKIGGVGCDAVVSVRGYARYLCHLDNPEKHQYDQGDVRQLSGADYVAAIGLPTDKYKAVQEMIDWCSLPVATLCRSDQPCSHFAFRLVSRPLRLCNCCYERVPQVKELDFR